MAPSPLPTSTARASLTAAAAAPNELSASSALYALREDRLVPLEPPTLHDVLLPQ